MIPAAGHITERAPMKTILFLCTGNACRSQMAEGFARATLPPEWRVMSAGVEAHGLNETAIEVMAAHGIDITQHHSKTIGELGEIIPDVVVTLCDEASEICPAFPASTLTLHWHLPDPAHAQGSEEDILAVFQEICDLIEQNVHTLVMQLQN